MRIPVLLSAVLFAAAAHAEWLNAGVPGTPRDVQTWRPGVYSVSTELGATLFQADGGTQEVPGTSAGTWLAPGDCLVSLLRSGGRLVGSGPACQPGAGSVFVDPSFASQRMRHDESGASFAISEKLSGLPPKLAYSPTGAGFIAGWDAMDLVPDNSTYVDALGVVRHDGSSYALLYDNTEHMFSLFNGLSLAGTIQFPGSPTEVITSIDLFNGGGDKPTALFGTDTGLYRLEFGNAIVPFSVVPLPTGTDRVAGVEVSTGTGTALADGFGLAVVQSGLGSKVLSAVPADNPSKVGAVWRVNPMFPIPGYENVRLKQVSCVGAEFCVITINQAGGQNLLVYRNASAPQIDVPPGLTVSEGQTTSHTVKVDDADGDAVLAAAAGFREGPLTVTATSKPEGVELQFAAGNICADYSVGKQVSIFASDGLASHERTASFPVTVRHTLPPGAPTISPEISVVAGTGPKSLQAAPGTGCPPQGWTWTALDGGPALGQDGGTASFPTPAVACEPQRYAYEVRTSDSAGTSDAGTFTVTVEPWGEPSAAFAPDSERDVIAGQSLRVTPEALHPCESSASFPGVDTVWSLGDGRKLPIPGVRLLDASGKEVSSLPVTSTSLTVDTDDCIDVEVPLSAYHRSRDAAGVRGPDSEVEVEVKTRLQAVAQGALNLVPTSGTDAPVITGRTAVSGLNCVERRPGLQARLRVQRQDGSEVGSPQTVPVPGDWSAAVDGCGETFRVSGSLLDEGAAEVGTVGEASVTTTRVPAALGELSEGSVLMAQCGEGARGTLTQTVPAEACSAARISWAYVDGPALASATFSGRTVDLATQATGLDGLVGRSVRVRVTADAGGGNVTQREHDVPITVEPFVGVTHETEKPSGSESGLLGVSVALRNRTACGVSDVVLEERLEGMAYVADSARLDGQPVTVEQEGDLLRVRGLALGGNAVHRFTYVARPTLLGTPRMQAQAFMGAVPITEGVRQVPPEAGCGCSSGSSGATAFGLAALAMRALRRRRTTGRS